MLRGTGVTGREIGFKNLIPISTPITLGEPKTEFGRMIKDAITPPKIDPRNSPYIEKQIITVVRLYNPDYGDNRVCVCGHTYVRHFDTYEDPDHQDVGCKYCGCCDFKEAICES